MSRQSGESKHKTTTDVKSIPAKRMYRNVLEYTRRLENGRQHRRNLMSVFQSEQIGHRHKLRDACEKLMFTHPLEYGRKAEELCWRKVYHEVIELVKKNKKFVKPGTRLELLYKQYLSAAIGYYHHLLLKLQAHYHLQLDVDWPFAHSPLSESLQRKRQTEKKKIEKNLDDDKEEKKEAESERVASKRKSEKKDDDRTSISGWARDTCYRILMCLGDLGRYQIEHSGSQTFAERFYQLALLVKPNTGMPFNQLGTLAGHHTWWGLSAVYDYYRCLEAEHTFEGADWNLQRLLDRNKKNFYQIPTDALESILTVENYREEHTSIFIISFLYLCDLLRPKTYATDVEITGMCKKLIDSLPVCLAHSAIVGSKDIESEFKENLASKDTMKASFKSQTISFPHHFHVADFSRLQPHIIFKMCVLCIINIQYLQSSRSNRSSAAIAFALAFFSHLLGHVISLLDPAENRASQIYGGEEMKENNENDKSVKNKENKVCENGEGDASHTRIKRSQQRRKKRTRVLRRRRHRGSGDSDLSEGEIMSGSADSDSDEHYDSSSSSATSSNSELSQEEVEDVIHMGSTIKMRDSSQAMTVNKALQKVNSDKEHHIVDNTSGLELANSLTNGQSALDSLKDISQKMFQPSVHRRIMLAPSFFNNITPKSKTTTSVRNVKKAKGMQDDNTVRNNNADKTEEDIQKSPGDQKESQGGGETKEEEFLEMNPAKGSDDSSEKPGVKEGSPDVTEKMATNEEAEDQETQHSAAELTKTFYKMAPFGQLFAALKLLCDWLSANEKVTSACAQNSKALWSRLTRLVNLLPDEDGLLEMDEVQRDNVLKRQVKIANSAIASRDKWRQSVRLPEDYILSQSTASVILVNEEKIKSLVCDLTDTQQSTIRVCRIRSFCHSLVHVEGLNMRFDEDTGRFEGPEEPSDAEAEHLDIETMEEMRKNRLMKDMAALRLRDEVSTLENQLGAKNTRDASLCLYLVPDALALCHDLPHIRRLLTSGRFFVVIPRTVIDGLDGLKKDLQGARDAIRFLETEFKKGNRFIRSQITEETCRGVQGERPRLRRNDMQAWRFYRMIECCRYISQEKKDKGGTSGTIAILTHSTDKATLSQNQINAISAAENFGIQVYSAVHFSELLKKLPAEPK